MRKYAKTMYLYNWTIYITACLIFYMNFDLALLKNLDYKSWITFGLGTIILITAGRFRKLTRIFSINRAAVGWKTGIEFFSLLILPFVLYIALIILSIIFISDSTKREHANHPLKSMFYGAKAIISGYVAISTYDFLKESLMSDTFSIMISIPVYMIIYLILSVSFTKPEKIKGVYEKDLVTSLAVSLFSGALAAFLFIHDPFSILLMIFPILFLYKALALSKKSKFIYLDEKTGLFNYRYFNEKSVSLFKRAVRENSKLSIIFADMDFLREINNQYGHQMGDKAIITVAKIIKELAGEEHLAARFGGEEFILVVRYEKERALKVAERIRRKVAKTTIGFEGEEIHLSISIGVSTFPQNAKSLEDLIKTADHALYTAKRKGRNQVQFYNSVAAKEFIFWKENV